MPKHRDRHSRGLRGPLSVANPITGEVVPRRRREPAAAWFISSVEAAVERIRETAPHALGAVTIGVEEVPTLPPTWTDAVPLAAATEAMDRRPAQVVVYRRPLELRATSREELDDLVHRTIVEQLAEITNLDPTSIDPGYERDA